MPSPRVASSLACLLVIGLGCNPTVTEAMEDEVGEDTTGDEESSSESSTSESGTESSDETTDTSDDPACNPGTLDCMCDFGACGEGLICVDEICIEGDPSEESESGTETGEPNQCGWDPRNEWYFCGWEGEDPSMEHPISCEEIGFPMVPGSPCNGMLDYIGCCDAMGNAWYCYEGLLEYEVCGAG